MLQTYVSALISILCTTTQVYIKNYTYLYSILTCKTNYFRTNNTTTTLLPFKMWSVLYKSGIVIHSVRVWLILRAQNAFIGVLHFAYFPYNFPEMKVGYKNNALVEHLNVSIHDICLII